MAGKGKSDILDEYSKNAQGPLVGKGNGVLTRLDNMNDKGEFTDALDSPSLEEVKHGETYGKKEYHGM